MIIIRVGLASEPLLRRRMKIRPDVPSAPSSDRSQRTGEDSFNLGWPQGTDGREMKRLAIEITHFRETDSNTVKGEELDRTTSKTPESLSGHAHAVSV